MRESEIEDYLKRRVEEIGGKVRKIKFLGVNGAPDRLLLLPERRTRTTIWPPCVVWVELKRPGAGPRQRQLSEHVLLTQHEQIVHVIDSKEGVDALLA